ncbi:hypothetical protein B1964_07060 [Gordonia sp. i37]|nr:hypothetical protein B1964_07060 [Gordonia sp. i37]
MTRENGLDVPKVRGGVAGLDVDLLVRFPGDTSRSAMKLTLYVPVPDIPDFAPVRVHNLRAHIWTSRDRAGGGMWFSADGIEPLEGPRAAKVAS